MYGFEMSNFFRLQLARYYFRTNTEETANEISNKYLFL